MLRFAPRIRPRILDEIERLSRTRLPIAEINRLVGSSASRMSLPRPSYERVRVLVHEARRLRRARPAAITVGLELGFRARLSIGLPRRRYNPSPRLGDRAPPSS